MAAQFRARTAMLLLIRIEYPLVTMRVTKIIILCHDCVTFDDTYIYSAALFRIYLLQGIAIQCPIRGGRRDDTPISSQLLLIGSETRN